MPTPEQQAAIDAANRRLGMLAGPAAPYAGPKAAAEVSSTEAGTALKGAQAQLTALRAKAEAQKAADRARQQAAASQQAIAARNSTYKTTQDILTTTAKIRSLIGDSTAGYGSLLKTLPESKARDLANQIQTLKSLNFQSALDDMRSQTKTGTPGIGRVMQAEIPLFVSRVATVDQSASGNSLRMALDRIDNSARTIYAAHNGDAPNLYSPDEDTAARTRAKYGIYEPGQERPSPLTAPYRGDATSGSLLRPGEMTKSTPIPPAMQREFESYVVPRLGKLSPDEYAAMRLGLDKKYGFADVNAAAPAEYKQEAEALNQAQARGIAPNLQIPPINAPATELEQLRARLEANPVTGRAESALAGAAGTVAKPFMTQDQLNKLSLIEAAHPGYATAGGIAASIPMTAAGLAAGIPAPLLFAGQGALGAYDPNAPVTSSALGAVTGAALGKAGEVGGKLIAGVPQIELPEIVQKYGLPATVGEVLGGAGRTAEAALAKLPFAGAALRARQAEGAKALEGALSDIEQGHTSALDDLTAKYSAQGDAMKARQAQELADLAASHDRELTLRKAGADQRLADLKEAHADELTDQTEKLNRDALQGVVDPIGGQHSGTIGNAGVAEAQNAVSNAYQNALSDVQIPITPEFKEAIKAATQKVADESTDQFANAFKRQMGGLLKSDVLDGEGYQTLMRRAGGLRSSASGTPEYQVVKDATKAVEDAALQMTTDAAPQVADQLAAANAARRRLGVVEDAASRSMGPAGGHPESGVFDPQTFFNATRSAAERFEGTPAVARGARQAGEEIPFFDTANAALAERQALEAAQAEREAFAKQSHTGSMADLKDAHGDAIDALKLQHAGEADTAKADLDAQRAVLDNLKASSTQAVQSAFDAAKNMPPKATLGAGTLAVPAIAALGDIGLEAMTRPDGGKQGVDADVALRDALLLGGAIAAPNVLYSKAAQEALRSRLIGSTASPLVQKYLPQVLAGVGVGYGARRPEIRLPDAAPGGLAQLPKPSVDNLPMYAPPEQAAPAQQDVPVQDDTGT